MRTNIEIPDDLWEKAKIEAVRKRVSLAEIIEESLRKYLKEVK